MIVYEMMMNINVFRMSWYHRRVRKWASGLVIAKDREWLRNRKFQDCKKCSKPKRLLESMSHSIVFSFSGGKSNGLLLNSGPRNQRSLKIKRVSGDIFLIHSVQCPVSIGTPNILHVSTEGSGDMWRGGVKTEHKQFHTGQVVKDMLDHQEVCLSRWCIVLTKPHGIVREIQMGGDRKIQQAANKTSDVPSPAWPESPGFGLAWGGSGLVKS